MAQFKNMKKYSWLFWSLGALLGVVLLDFLVKVIKFKALMWMCSL